MKSDRVKALVEKVRERKKGGKRNVKGDTLGCSVVRNRKKNFEEISRDKTEGEKSRGKFEPGFGSLMTDKL